MATKTKPKARALRMTSPHMHGGDVELFQRTVNEILSKWEVTTRLTVDGDYGEHTRDLGKSVAYGMGLALGPINEQGFTPDVRIKLRDPKKRTKAELERSAGRVDWRRRLRKRYASTTHGPDMAVAYAQKHVGITESPPASNLGPQISAWQRQAGYAPPVYWCGCFANACLVAAGLPSQMWGIGYCPSIEARAKAGIGGWKWYPASHAPIKGALALFTESGVAGHVELVTADGSPLRTIGGNTSSGTGSASNGGGVFAHNFATYRGLPLRGFAMPPY